MKKYLATYLTIVLIITKLAAQTGPAGVQNGSEPGLVFWLRADQGISTSGSVVTNWADQINSNDANAGAGPSVSSGALNGFDALLFNGTDNNLTIGNSTRINDGNSTNRTLYVVFETGSTLPGSGTYQLIYEEGGGTNGLNVYIENGEIVLYMWEDQNGSLDANQEYFARVTAAINTTYIAAIKYEGDGTTGRVDFYLNDASALTLGSPLAMPTANLAEFSSHTGDINLGGAPDSGDTQFVGDQASTGDYFDGLIAEMLYYDVTLNDAEFQIVYNYLAEKYDVILGSGDFYTEANYNNEIQGVGQEGGEQHLISLGNGGGLYIEDNGGIDSDGEFVLAGHDNSNFSQTSGNVSVSGVDRYNRSWFIEKTGTVNGVKLIFNTNEVGLGAADDFGRVAGDYTLLYRSTTGGLFTDVGVSATLSDDAGAGDGSDDVVFSLSDVQLQNGYYTLGVPENQTWYSYTTGNWSEPGSWTLDGSATPLLLNPGNEIPDANDNVVVTNGRTITMDVDNVTLQSMQVIGRLILSTTTGHDFTTIDGNGTIRMSGDGSGNDNFPSGITTGANGFSNVNNGGTLELRGAGINLDQSREFNDIWVNMTSTSNAAVVLADYTINGDLTISTGTFRINNNTATTNLDLDLFGNMVIEANGELRVGTGNGANTRHQFNLYGDFTNNGYAQFSDRTVQNVNTESPNGIVDFNLLSDNQDQDIDCNAPTYFYRIVIFKGTDDTYEARFDTNNSNNFEITGPVDYGFPGGNADFPTQPADNQNAFAPITGNAVIGTDVVIDPLYADGADGNSEGAHFRIGENARLTVDGGTVANRNNRGSITLFGTLDVKGGTVISEGNDGISLRLTGTLDVSGGTVNTVNIKTASGGGSSNFGGYIQSGGTVNVGEFAGSGGTNGSFHQFELPRPTQAFIMSGGTLNIQDPTGANRGLLFINSDPGNINVTGGTVNLITNNNNVGYINSKAPFYNLVITNTSSNVNARVAVDAGDVGGVFGVGTVPAQDLRVLNDLTIETGTTRSSGGNDYGSYLDLCPDGISCVDLEVGGDLRIEDSAVLDFFTDAVDDSGSATLTFNGEGDAEFYIGDITTYDASLTDYDDPDGDGSYVDYRHPIYNLVIDKNGSEVRLAAKSPALVDDGSILFGGGKNLDSNNARLLYISNGLTIASGSTLNQIDPVGGGIYGYIVRVYAPTINVDGNLLVYEQGVNPTNSFLEVREVDPDDDPATDVGDVILINSTEGSTIGNLVVDLGNDELQIASDLAVTRFVYRHGGVNIGSYNLKVDIFDFNTETSGGDDSYRLRRGNGENLLGENTSGARQYIYTDGNASDGGLSIRVPRVANNIQVADDTQNIGNDPSYDNENDEYQNTDLLWFPVGLSDRYTPAIMWVVDDGTVIYNDDEYVTVRPVAGELQTTDLGGGAILQYYWRVGHEGFDGGLPTVSWLFQYDQDDVSGNEANYVPGKVLDGGTYDRYYDGTEEAVKNANTSGNGSAGENNENHNLLGGNPGNVIIFNGVNNGNTLPFPANLAVDDIDNGTNNEVFNGFNVTGNWDPQFPSSTGFTLENANYTAGEATRFVGAPTIYYTREGLFGTAGSCLGGCDVDALEGSGGTGNPLYFGCAGVQWDFDQGSNGTYDVWSTTGHGGAAVSTLPGAGDIVQIHQCGKVVVSDESVTFAQVVNDGGLTFDALTNTDAYNSVLGTIEGSGLIRFDLRNGGTSPTSLPEADYGSTTSGFVSAIGAQFVFRLLDNSNYSIPSGVGIYPTTQFFSASSGTGFYNNPADGNFGATRKWFLPAEDLTINGNAIIQAGARVLLNTGSDGDLTILGDLNIGTAPGPNRIGALQYQTSGASRTVTVEGDIFIRNGGNGDGDEVAGLDYSAIEVLDGGSPVEHRLIAKGDIRLQEEGRIDLNGTASNVILELAGESSNQFSQDGSSANPDLYQIVMNKGTDQSNSFSFNDSFDIPDATAIFQPVEIVNGTLILSSTYNSGSGILIANGSDFPLPNTDNIEASSGSGGLEIAAGTVRIEGDDTGILLDGLLRISGGALDMLDAANNGNNFIEYSSSGNARIELTAGNLFVGSQVRRGLNNTTGVLQYSQTGGTALFGFYVAPEASRGVFEVLNAGSEFEYTGGASSTLSIVRDNNSLTVPTLRLSPSTHSIGDGNVIYIGTADTPGTADDDFGIYSDISLDGLAIGQENSTIDPTAKIYGVALEVNDLIIGNNGNSTFDAQGFDLTVNESFTNEGVFTASGSSVNQQTTSFPSSAASTINSVTGNGTTTFYNFEKSGNGVLTVSKDFLVQNELRIEAGTFATGTQAINVEGDVTNLSNHTSSDAPPNSDLYGIILSGTNRQNLIGIGGAGNVSNFGVLAINNPEGVLIPDGSEFTFEIADRLLLEQGVLDISSNLFIFSEDAIVLNEDGNSGVSDFNVTNMIQTNSSFTDFGVRKKFTSGVQTDFVFPVGQQAYTPVEIDMNAALSGTLPTLTVRPANESHPTVIDHANTGSNSPGTLDDQLNVLQYHWILTSDGISSFTGDISMRYDPTDVSLLDPGDATAAPLSFDTRNYAAARLLFSGTNWDKSFDGGSFDQNNNLIIFNEASAFSGVGDNAITGDYTAGLLVEDDETTPLDVGAIPNTVLEYETLNATGDFSVSTDWVGINGAPPLGAGETPSGSIIYVRNGDQMNITTPNARIYRTVIEDGGVLSINEDADNTRLGLVEGTGTLRIESNTVGQSPQLPAGYYADFLTCSGGGLEYAGSVDYEVLANISQIRQVVFSGSGDRELPNSNLLICDDFILRDGVSVTNSSNRQLTIQGDVIKSDGSIVDFGTGDIILNGSISQQIVGNFTGVEAFYNLEIDNNNGVTIVNSSADATNGISSDVNGDVEISNRLTLTDGIVNTDNANDLRMLFNSTINAPANGSTNTHVDGPLIRVLDRDAGEFEYPVGNNGRNGFMKIHAPDIASPEDWKVQYISGSPTNNPDINGVDNSFIETSSQGIIDKASDNEYWLIDVNGSATSNIELHWDNFSDVWDQVSTPSEDALDNLRILAWDPAVTPSADRRWSLLITETAPTGTVTAGHLVSGPLSYSTKYVTFGTTDATVTPLPVTLLHWEAHLHERGVMLDWATASEINNDRFEIYRSLNGEEWELIGEVEGNGNTNQTIDYKFLDKNPSNGINFYRYKQIDYDGQFEYSPVAYAEYNGQESYDIMVYPNPNFGSEISLDIVGGEGQVNAAFMLFSIEGRPVRQGYSEGRNHKIDIEALPQGLYFLKVQIGDKTYSKKIIKSR